MLKNEARLSIASLIFGIKVNEPRAIEQLKERYALYHIDAKPEVKINICYNSNEPQLSKDRVFASPYYIYGDFKKDLEFKVYTKRKYVDIGSLLRFITSALLIRKGGFLLHSCGVIINDGAYLLAGPSGSGKTTISRLIDKGYVLLSDETTAVIKQGKEYSAYATPFFGDFGRITSNQNARLKAILFLKQSGHFKHKRINSLSAAARLLQNIFLLGGNSRYNMDNIDRLFDIAVKVTKRIPTYELEFLPEARLWKYIEEKISRGAQ